MVSCYIAQNKFQPLKTQTKTFKKAKHNEKQQNKSGTRRGSDHPLNNDYWHCLLYSNGIKTIFKLLKPLYND